MKEPLVEKKRKRAPSKCSACGSTDHNIRKCESDRASELRLDKKKKKSKELTFGQFQAFGTQVVMLMMSYLDVFSLIKFGIAFDGYQSLISSIMCTRTRCKCFKKLNVDEKRYSGCACGENAFKNIVKNIRMGYYCICCGVKNSDPDIEIIGQKFKRSIPTPYLTIKYPDIPKSGNPRSKWRYFRIHEDCQPTYKSQTSFIYKYVSNVEIAEFGADCSLLYHSRSMLNDICLRICMKHDTQNFFFGGASRILNHCETGQEIGYKIVDDHYYAISESFFEHNVAPILSEALVSLIQTLKKITN